MITGNNLVTAVKNLRTMTSYQITREIRLYHTDDGWFYQFNDDGEGCIEVSAFETLELKATKTSQTLHIPKDCIESFISILREIK